MSGQNLASKLYVALHQRDQLLQVANDERWMAPRPVRTSGSLRQHLFLRALARLLGAIEIATELMELHRKYWPGFEGEAEVRPMFDPGMGP